MSSSDAAVDGALSENREVLAALRASCREPINVDVSEVSPELVSCAHVSGYNLPFLLPIIVFDSQIPVLQESVHM